MAPYDLTRCTVLPSMIPYEEMSASSCICLPEKTSPCPQRGIPSLACMPCEIRAIRKLPGTFHRLKEIEDPKFECELLHLDDIHKLVGSA